MPSSETNAARATLSKRRRDVARMFDHVAHRYDLTNTMMTMGEERRWRQRVVEAVDPRPGQLVLDLAAGTGTSSQTFADRGAQVVAADLSLGMLGVGQQRQPELDFLAADALSLPFADDSFDTVTITFGLRNVEDSDSALAEMRRVTRPGGRLVVAEFSTPTWSPFRVVYSEYLMAAVPGIARVFSSNPIAYEYLAESVQAWPDQTELAEKITAAGWQRVEWRNLSGGIVAIHRAYA